MTSGDALQIRPAGQRRFQKGKKKGGGEGRRRIKQVLLHVLRPGYLVAYLAAHRLGQLVELVCQSNSLVGVSVCVHACACERVCVTDKTFQLEQEHKV